MGLIEEIHRLSRVDKDLDFHIGEQHIHSSFNNYILTFEYNQSIEKNAVLVFLSIILW